MTGSGGLMEDLKRCRRKSDARCVHVMKGSLMSGISHPLLNPYYLLP